MLKKLHWQQKNLWHSSHMQRLLIGEDISVFFFANHRLNDVRAKRFYFQFFFAGDFDQQVKHIRGDVLATVGGVYVSMVGNPNPIAVDVSGFANFCAVLQIGRDTVSVSFVNVINHIFSLPLLYRHLRRDAIISYKDEHT